MAKSNTIYAYIVVLHSNAMSLCDSYRTGKCTCIAKVSACLYHTCNHRIFCLTKPNTWIIELLVRFICPVWVADLTLEIPDVLIRRRDVNRQSKTLKVMETYRYALTLPLPCKNEGYHPSMPTECQYPHSS